MEHEMKNLEIAKSYFPNFAKPKLDPKDVCVPNEILEECEEKIKKYREGVKKFRHASAKSKAYHFLYGEDRKDESERKDNLQKIFDETGAWFWYVKETFKGCKGSEKIQKYVDEMQKDFNKLKRKGYIKQLTKEYVNKFPKEHKDKMFNKGKYALENNPIHPVSKYTNTYAELIESTYNLFYAQLYEILFHYDHRFKRRIKQAKKLNDLERDSTAIFTDTIRTAENILEDYDKMYNTLKEDVDKYYDSPSLKFEKDRIIRQYKTNVKNLSRGIAHIKKVHMNAFFRKYFYSQLHITENMDTVQIFNENLTEFYDIATSNEHSFKKLSGCYNQLVDEYKELKPILKTISTTKGRKTHDYEGLDSYERDEITQEIARYKLEIESRYDKIRDSFANFEDTEKKYKAACLEYEKAKSEHDKMIKFHAAFAILGIVLPVFSALTPLIQLAIAPTPAPVAPVAPVPQG